VRAGRHVQEPVELFPEEDISAMIKLYFQYLPTHKTRIFATMVKNATGSLRKYTREQFKSKIQYLRDVVKDPRMNSRPKLPPKNLFFGKK